MQTIFEGSSCRAIFLEEKKRIFFTFDGYLNIDEVKKMYMEILSLMKTKEVKGFLHDFIGLKGTFTGLTDWVISTMKPALELGLKYQAMVLNNDIFTSFAINDFIGKTSVLEIQVFKDLKEAEAWLDERIS